MIVHPTVKYASEKSIAMTFNEPFIYLFVHHVVNFSSQQVIKDKYCMAWYGQLAWGTEIRTPMLQHL